jgi:uncharacterized protein (TIGR02996 family)
MPTAAELYDAILADPDNVDLRLQYADAVSDTDPDHAELIRLQVDETRTRQAGAIVQDGVRARIDTLVSKVRPRLAGPIAALVERHETRNGFIDLVRMTARGFLDSGETVSRYQPVRFLELTKSAGLMAELAATPLLQRLTSLDFYGNEIGDAGVAQLAAPPYLGKLRWLGLARCGVGAAGAEALAAAPSFRNLRYVHFADNLVELTPQAAAHDWDGTVLEVELPPLGKRLNDQYGPLAWLERYARKWMPDVDEV